jgi:co-chaperonin GroES (HSP10)
MGLFAGDVPDAAPHLRLVNDTVIEQGPLRRRVSQDFVMFREVADLDQKARGIEGSKILAPTQYDVTGSSKDKMFLGEVVDLGHSERGMAVALGDLCVANLSSCSYKLTERGLKYYLYRNDSIAAHINRETFAVRPLQYFILVKENEGRALAHHSGGPIWLPTSSLETDDEMSSKHRPGLVAEYGEVVDVGPGGWRDGVFHKPDCKAGDLIMYDASFGTVPITVRGRSFTLVPCYQQSMIADEAPCQ